MKLTAKECILLQEALAVIKPKASTEEQKRELHDLNSKLFDIANQSGNGSFLREMHQKM